MTKRCKRPSPTGRGQRGFQGRRCFRSPSGTPWRPGLCSTVHDEALRTTRRFGRPMGCPWGHRRKDRPIRDRQGVNLAAHSPQATETPQPLTSGELPTEPYPSTQARQPEPSLRPVCRPIPMVAYTYGYQHAAEPRLNTRTPSFDRAAAGPLFEAWLGIGGNPLKPGSTTVAGRTKCADFGRKVADRKRSLACS